MASPGECGGAGILPHLARPAGLSRSVPWRRVRGAGVVILGGVQHTKELCEYVSVSLASRVPLIGIKGTFDRTRLPLEFVA